ncbi:hypothetical protein EJB05_14275, partial [Eragrostis curvula]
MPVSVPASGSYNFDMKHGALTRDNIYPCSVRYEDKFAIAKYELGNHSLSMIDLPDDYKTYPLLMPNKDGSLGLAVNKNARLYLWSRTVNTQGIDEWIQWRVIELDKLLPICKSYCNHVYVSGFVEDVGLIYLSIENHAVFTYELKLGRVTKVSELGGFFQPSPSYISTLQTVSLIPAINPHPNPRSISHERDMAPPPDLIDDAITEILLRLPPDDPACLFRAAVVCKLWRRVLFDPAFSRRYREFHRTPPLLGLLHNTFRQGYGRIPRFVPSTAASSPFPQKALLDGRRCWWIADCRHGRVLATENDNYIVWDPIAGNWEELRRPKISCSTYSAAVLCAVAGCSHRDYHGGPFHIIFVYYDVHRTVMNACVYSSEARDWGTPASIQPGGGCGYGFDMRPGALARDTYYCNIADCKRIVMYEFGSHSLSMIHPPDFYDMGSLLMPKEDGGLGLAGIKGSKLYLWSRMLNPEGIIGWMQWRVIELDKLPPFGIFFNGFILGGFAENMGFIYMTTGNAIYRFELKSGRLRKESETWVHFAAVFPFISFYTPDYASGKLPLLANTK